MLYWLSFLKLEGLVWHFQIFRSKTVMFFTPDVVLLYNTTVSQETRGYSLASAVLTCQTTHHRTVFAFHL